MTIPGAEIDRHEQCGPFTAADPYIQTLSAWSNKTVYVKPYDGNAGDELIVLGTRRLLQQCRIEVVLDPRAADLILMPGGNPTLWPIMRREWEYCLKVNPRAKFLIGPISIALGAWDWPAMLNTHAPRVAGVFARDHRSFERLQRSGLDSSVATGLSHDPAFALRGSPWIEEHRRAASAEYALATFRADREQQSEFNLVERLARRLPMVPSSLIERRSRHRNAKRNAQRVVAAVGLRLPVNVCDAATLSFDLCVETVRRAAEVHTDRLHMTVLGALLGKPVYSYSVSFKKIQSVWERSGGDWGNVTFVGAEA